MKGKIYEQKSKSGEKAYYHYRYSYRVKQDFQICGLFMYATPYYTKIYSIAKIKLRNSLYFNELGDLMYYTIIFNVLFVEMSSIFHRKHGICNKVIIFD